MDWGLGNNLGLDAGIVGVGQVGCWQRPASTGRKSWGCQVRGGKRELWWVREPLLRMQWCAESTGRRK